MTATRSRATPEAIAASVVASFDGCDDPRLREIMQALAKHLHAFAIEVGLTQEEWQRAPSSRSSGSAGSRIRSSTVSVKR